MVGSSRKKDGMVGSSRKKDGMVGFSRKYTEWLDLLGKKKWKCRIF